MNKLLDSELARGVAIGLAVGGVALALAWPHLRPAVLRAPPAPSIAALHAPVAPVGERRLDLRGEAASADVLRLAQWVVDSADNGARHFVVLDKKNARVFVFQPNGRLQGATPVLLGYASGDDTVPGIGQRPIESVRPEERTTPAGRFIAEPGRNAIHEDVVWVDYGAAVSMHRVRLTDPKERRAERLASPTASDNRISYGCINMPPAFFEQVLWPVFRAERGIVYVLPEVKPLTDVFPGLAAQGAAVNSTTLPTHGVTPPAA